MRAVVRCGSRWRGCQWIAVHIDAHMCELVGVAIGRSGLPSVELALGGEGCGNRLDLDETISFPDGSYGYKIETCCRLPQEGQGRALWEFAPVGPRADQSGFEP
jgi:hypothetical protein